jgi:predicted nucleic acid-binding protein
MARRVADALAVATALDVGLPVVTADRRLASGGADTLLLQKFA